MTNSPQSPLVLYGVPFSQPVRAVMWLLLYKQVPFEMVLINPGSKGDNGSRSASYLAKNPAGTIPCLEDPATGFTVGEAHAILAYVCSRYSFTDLYPEDLEHRALVDAYLHYHHRNVRDASTGLVAPKVRKDLDIPQVMQDLARKNVTRSLKALNDRWLADSSYLIRDQLTVADFAAYVELGQLQACFTNLFDFAPFPNVERWLETMKQVAEHDVVHTVLAEIGDISVEAPSMDAIRAANKGALRALKGRLGELGGQS